jgi:hypothetical protein
MNLHELQESKKTKVVKRALKEHYELELDFDKLPLEKTKKMLTQVRGLIKESRSKGGVYSSHENATYLKLMMVEQALVDHLGDIRNPAYRLVVENEEVLKSQVILAAQDLVDSLQKMLEEVSKMNVEELNAVVDGIKNEFGAAEGANFGEAAGAALSTLQDAIQAAKQTLSSALETITGDEIPADIDTDIDMEVDAVDTGAGADSGEVEPEPVEEPEQEPVNMAGVGRERR